MTREDFRQKLIAEMRACLESVTPSPWWKQVDDSDGNHQDYIEANYPGEADREALREVLAECIDTLKMAERPEFVDPVHGDEVRMLGNRIGYGALMSSASALWRARLLADGDPVGGEFTCGPCRSTVAGTINRAARALLPRHQDRLSGKREA
ncbi:hypothetical protein NKH72_24300 [Mesorhizobium sp. M0955]|uniref:hypothetical protein n=1 Tax=Mesorhizobium sp. M0955 TaxID=2957033 RepID=UPI0033386B65